MEIGLGLAILASLIIAVQETGLILSVWGVIAGVTLILEAIRLKRTAQETRSD